MKKSLLVLLLFLLSSCEILGPERADVFGSIDDSTVVLRNTYGVPVYYFVFGRQNNIILEWVPGSSKDNEIQHGKSVEIPLEEIFAIDESKEINVYWWDTDIVDGQTVAKEIRHFILSK